MTKTKLTDKQRAVLGFIEQLITTRGVSPTIREIGQKFGIASTNGVRLHINALIKKGYLKKNEFLARGLELVRPLTAGVGRVPLVGTVPAGNPIDAVENIEGEIALDLSFLPKSDAFTLRVVGDSMKNAGIFNGDIVLVQKQAVARKGEIIIAIIGDEATVKRYFPEGDQIRLQPENELMKPIIVKKSSGDFRIAGKVVGLLRKF